MELMEFGFLSVSYVDDFCQNLGKGGVPLGCVCVTVLAVLTVSSEKQTWQQTFGSFDGVGGFDGFGVATPRPFAAI